jgi:hypothetical protein
MQLAAKHQMLPFTSSQMGLDGIRAQYGVLAHAHRDLGKPLDNLRLGI